MLIRDKLPTLFEGQSLQKAVSRRLDAIAASSLLALLESLKTPLGEQLRRTAYRLIFQQIGPGVALPPGLEFAGTRRIALGAEVKLHRSVRLRSLSHRSSVRIGDRVTLDKGVDLKAVLGAIEIGCDTYIGPYTCLSGGKIQIGDGCLIASHCGIYANNHIFAAADRWICKQGNSFKGITIEENCWLGSGVRVVDGITIGRGSAIGAGAVVTRDIPPYSVAVGVPAKAIAPRPNLSPEQLLAFQGLSVETLH